MTSTQHRNINRPRLLPGGWSMREMTEFQTAEKSWTPILALGPSYWPIAFFVLAHRIVKLFRQDCSSLCSILNTVSSLYTSLTTMSRRIILFLAVAFNFLVLLLPPHSTSIFLMGLAVLVLLSHYFTPSPSPTVIPFPTMAISVCIFCSLSFLLSSSLSKGWWSRLVLEHRWKG